MSQESNVEPSVDQSISILRRMLVMRRFEEEVVRLHAAQHISGIFHLYIGQEGTGAAALEAAEPDDYVLTTHRNHGHVVGRGADLGAAFAELLGRSTGLLGGRGGGFHMSAPALHMLQTSAMVGGAVGLATGAALGLQRAGRAGIAVAFFGDASLEEGVAYESFTLAKLWRLPIVYICENNSIGVTELSEDSFSRSMLPAERLSSVPEMVGITTIELSNGLNADEVFAAVTRARRQCLAGNGPVFIESPIVRYPGSRTLIPTSIGDTDLALASGGTSAAGPHREWKEDHDPLIRWARKLVAAGTVTKEELASMDTVVVDDVAAASRFAVDSPYPDPLSATDRIFAPHPEFSS